MTLKDLNYSMFKCAEHLLEAGRYMLILNRERGIQLMAEADMILKIIQPEAEKVPEEKLESIMNEIMSINAGEK